MKDKLYQQGAEVSVSVHEVNKLNESYEAITVTPAGSNIGVNIGIDKFYDAILLPDVIAKSSVKKMCR